jgi:hypothetical protein
LRDLEGHGAALGDLDRHDASPIVRIHGHFDFATAVSRLPHASLLQHRIRFRIRLGDVVE